VDDKVTLDISDIILWSHMSK